MIHLHGNFFPTNSIPFHSTLVCHSKYTASTLEFTNAEENWEIFNDGKESNKSGYNLRSLEKNKSHRM